jgi:hypothetical protein
MPKNNRYSFRRDEIGTATGRDLDALSHAEARSTCRDKKR